MDLPSMVQRSGDTLIVRSVVSGNQLYMDQTGGHHNNNNNHNNNNSSSSVNASPHTNQNTAPPVTASASSSATSALEQQLERYRIQQLLQQQQTAAAVAVVNSVQQQHVAAAAAAALDAKEEGLPQCKIKRNYSCNHCAYFTQNPRYHLTHLRDVHGEKIVINKCKLCLYASRHFQKLVRHMKMVHGCTDGIPSGHGQARGKRGMSREARKRRLEESVGVMDGGQGQAMVLTVPDMPTLEQVKRELQLQEQKLQRGIEAYNQRQREEQQQLNHSANLLMTNYERQLQALRELEARESYEREVRQSPPEQQQQQHLGLHNISADYHMPDATVELATPSPSGSATPPSTSGTPQPATAHGGGYEEPQNRLLKCSVCDFTTLYRAQLVDHELEDHQKTKFFRCDKCSYVTHIKARFSKHVKYHSMPMIKCVTCDFRTPYKWNLDRHMKNHGGTGPFKCAACDFTADIKQSLTVHEMNHHVPPVGNAAGISLSRRRNKVGGTDLCDDFLSDSAELEDQYNNNNVDEEYEEALLSLHCASKRGKYEEDEPTDLSQKGGSSDTSSVGTATPRAKRPVPNLIPITKSPKDVLNLSKDTNASRSSLTEIASMFFNEKQISEMLDKSDVPQLSPTTTLTSHHSTTSSHHSRSLLSKKPSGSFFDKLKTSGAGAQHENLICQCGHVAKCLSESIIHGKSCQASAVIIDDDELNGEDEHEDDADDRLEIDEDDDDRQSHSALNLSVSGSTRCQHCRHRCKSSTDLLHHLTQCTEAIRCANEMYDSNSGDDHNDRSDSKTLQQQAAVQQQRVCIWNKAAKEIAAAVHHHGADKSKSMSGSPGSHGHSGHSVTNEENSYYGVETAPGYGEVTKKMTPEEEAANSSLKKVYKCPHCSFWASTASRFHVHIVGHLNKKPFECSLCSYRSNWRWDITKHIRLKTIRDPSHKTAKVLMNDETGRRNYTKYNKYITLMKVTEEDGDPKLMKSGEMTPNQVASLAFLKDYNKSNSQHDITLEPVSPSKPNALDDAHLADNLIRLPLLATMMNAAMAQQQHQQNQKDHQEQSHGHGHGHAMITPSVTISPVKRGPNTPPSKPSDDLITEVHQEGSEKKTFYRCRKCNFRHHNRDAVLAHVKVHQQDPNFPIVTATVNSGGASKLSTSSSASTTPLQVSVNSNPQHYMNKVFAAMCLSQNSPTAGGGSVAGAASNNNNQHSIISAGLLQRAIQEAQHSPTPSASALSGLALALAGASAKCPTTTTPKASAASILEHGEQKASQNEASADSLTSPNITSTATAGSGASSFAAMSLQDLLTSPRATNHTKHGHHNNHSSLYGAGASTTSSTGTANSQCVLTNSNANNNSVMVSGYDGGHKQTPSAVVAASSAAYVAASSTNSNSNSNSNTTPPTYNTSPLPVTTIPTPTSSTSFPTVISAKSHNLGTGNQQQQHSSHSDTIHRRLIDAGDGCFYTGNGVTHAHTNPNSTSITSSNTAKLLTTTAAANSSSPASSLSSSSASLLLSSSSPASSSSASNASASPHSSSSPPSSSFLANANATQAARFHNHSPSSPSLLTVNGGDGDRRDPSPYRCGHCHQVSNWKHVIQRHCRLKHSGDIRIETLERNANAPNAAPMYRPLGAGATNESHSNNNNNSHSNNNNNNSYNHSTKLSNNNNNSSSLLMTSKQLEQLLHSPLSASAAAVVNAANTQQDLQAAAAYWAAACKAASAVANGSAGGLSAEDLLQLQQNDQIEITRLPATQSGNLAQLLEQTQQSSASNNNTKSKQQKCPVCPYISESKSQMNYHVSLHKPTQYECRLCTFVCAKKQHLSSHMRSAHQQQLGGSAAAGGAAPAAGGNASALGLDFSVALQLAAAAKQAQTDALNSTPLTIDLSHLKLDGSAGIENESPQQLPPEYQYKLISYCSKCPARFAQKHNDERNAKLELEQHLRAHSPSELDADEVFICAYCEFRASAETLLQLHRAVHMSHYQEKCQELYKNCKEDVDYPAPKLMHIAGANRQMPETIWVVDNELGAQLLKQNVSGGISSSTPPPPQPPPAPTGSYDNNNSLLKKQLESGGAGGNVSNCEPTPAKDDEDELLSNSTPSTSASVATSDLAADASSDAGSLDMPQSAPAPERCLHCPFETHDHEQLRQHLQHHPAASQQLPEAHSCAHCDYTDAEESQIEEHTVVHFNASEKLKAVEFYTCYDKLEISVEQEPDAALADVKQEAEHNNNQDNAINANVQQAEQEQAQPAKKPSNKIILYKNDGALSVKPSVEEEEEEESAAPAQRCENISDRLRRRILRGNSSTPIAQPASALADGGSEETMADKMILVNAKTGKVISRK